MAPSHYRSIEARAWTFLGQRLQRGGVRLIQAVVADCAALSRGELAATLCELLAWTRPTGRTKDRECRTLLEAMAAGVIALPAKQTGRPLGARTAVPPTIDGDTRHVVGCVHCTSAAWRLRASDAWIGLDDAIRARQLLRIVTNSHLLIAPWVKVRNLASTILAQLTRGLAAGWHAAYGVRPLLLETLVDPSRFAGTCYRAVNWIPVGLTTGRGRTGRRRTTHSANRLFVHPLVRNAVAQLRGA